MNNTTKIKSDELTKVALFCLLCAQLLLANGWYLLLCYATGIFLFTRLAQPLKPGIFAIMAAQHLLQVVAGVWQANYLDRDLNYRSYFTDRATILALIGILFLFAPLIYEQSRLKKMSFNQLKEHADKLSTQHVLNVYIVVLFITSALAGVAFLYSGITQIVISMMKLKWLFFLLFGYVAVLKKERLLIFFALAGFEFISGFYSFFSEFKTVIYFMAVLMLTFVASINFRQLSLAALIIIVLGYLGIMWTSVKGEYRSYLNQGTEQQATVVGKDDAMDKLVSLSNEKQQKGTGTAVADMLDRIQYTFHFAKTLERVPAFIPYQDGANWMDNIEFATTPRFLNPDKPSIDNSLKASKYTGIKYASARQGASFSLGYFAEFYIDFGSYLMMPAIFVLGFIYSRLFRFFVTKSSDNAVFNYAVVCSFFFEFYNFEMDGTFLAGRLLASLVTFLAFIFLLAKPILKYMAAPRMAPSQKDV